MIVRREEGVWHLISQVDHAHHAAGLSDAWKQGPFGGEDITPSLRYATAEHDLGWTDPDLEPSVDPQTGAPSNFIAIDEARHTSFYSQAVRTIANADPTAAYLVSLHASGLYSRRYAWTGLKPVDWYSIGEHGRALLESEREFRTQLISRIPSAETEFESTWRSYMLLETFDCLSLLTCFGFDCARFGPVPTASGQWEMLTVRRAGPWIVALDPFPFAAPELVVEVPCRRFDQERFAGADELRDALAATPKTPQQTVYRPF
jgi:hypothetical protein